MGFEKRFYDEKMMLYFTKEKKGELHSKKNPEKCKKKNFRKEEGVGELKEKE